MCGDRGSSSGVVGVSKESEGNRGFGVRNEEKERTKGNEARL